MGTVLQNLTISNFREFRYFVGITSSFTFGGSHIGTLILPPSIKDIEKGMYSHPFYRSTIDKLIISEGADLGSDNGDFYYSEIKTWVLGNSCSKLWSINNVNQPRRTVLLMADTVKPIQGQSYYNKSRSNIEVYVPDELVDDYKADATWQGNFNTDKIHPISEYDGTIWE